MADFPAVTEALKQAHKDNSLLREVMAKRAERSAAESIDNGEGVIVTAADRELFASEIEKWLPERSERAILAESARSLPEIGYRKAALQAIARARLGSATPTHADAVVRAELVGQTVSRLRLDLDNATLALASAVR